MMADRPIRLLYIDDDEIFCALVRKEFERNGYVVECAQDGAAGLARLAEGGIDVVALDHHMPEQSGLEVLPHIMQLSDPPPVVYVTGESQGQIAVAALKAGAEDYVFKDASVEFLPLLRAAIDAAVAARRTRRAKEEAEQELRASRDRFERLAAERELLLHEVNHRVANSLQMVSAFLRLQMSAAPGADTKATLAAAMARVDAIGNVHKQLHASSSVNLVDLAPYLGSLIAGLGRGVVGTGSATELSVDCEPVTVATDTAMALGLIATELVINALKHAFPEPGGGHIQVSCRRSAGGGVLLSVEDDGQGITREAAENPGTTGTGLGQRVISMLAAKLGAEVQYESRARGTRVMVRLPGSERRIGSAA